ncbi:MAG: replicative DNA helicase [Acidobacteriota bacterium]|nr:replicative DNA helicase [Acidobacteriota bacterium]
MIEPAVLEQKTLPHSEESERAVLAAILLDPPRHLPTTAGRLQPEDFYSERHQCLFQTMLDLQGDGVEIDVRTLQARLEQQDRFEQVGGLAYVATLDVDLPDLGRVEHYVEIVKERSLRRRLIAASSDIFRNCQDGGVEAKEALGRAEQAILELGEEAIPQGFVQVGEAIRDTVYDLEESPGKVFTGTPSGFPDFDRMTHGLSPGNLVIVAGRPGMGKSSFAMNVAQNVCLRSNGAVAVFSLEMSVTELSMRVLCSESRVPLGKLRSAKLSDRDWESIHQAAKRTADAKLYIDDSANPSLLEVTSKARRLKLEHGIDLLILDYLQLMQAGGRHENRNLEIAAITRGLKQLAKEVNIPVMALSQLSRQPERRGSDHRPQLADLRESGAIEQDADLVAFVYRPEVYEVDNEDVQGLAELIVSKNRNGQTGTVELAWDGQTTTFWSLDRHSPV